MKRKSRKSTGSRARALAVTFAVAALSSNRSGRADVSESTASAPSVAASPPYRFTIRALAGLGDGSLGFGGRAAVSGEGWLNDHIGLGGFASASSQETCILCAGQEESTEALGLGVALRTAPSGHYGLLAIGAGYAWARRQETEGLQIFGASAPPPATRHSGVIVNGTLAWLFHAGPLEIGPGLVFEVTEWASTLVTANLAVGVALP